MRIPTRSADEDSRNKSVVSVRCESLVHRNKQTYRMLRLNMLQDLE
jgi:hypothetical protein